MTEAAAALGRWGVDALAVPPKALGGLVPDDERVVVCCA